MPGLLHTAAEFAVKAHQGIDRKSSILPYVSHPFDVLKRLSRWGVAYEPLLAAALLHDVVEDTDVTLDQIEETFGADVRGYVEFVTWPEGVKTKKQKFDYLTEKVAKRPGPDASRDQREMWAGGVILKTADRVCNVRDYNDAELRGDRPADGYPAKYALLAYPFLREAFDLPEQDRGFLNDFFWDELRWLGVLIGDHFTTAQSWVIWTNEDATSMTKRVREALFPPKKTPSN